jgi:hypothetical protein
VRFPDSENQQIWIIVIAANDVIKEGAGNLNIFKTGKLVYVGCFDEAVCL